MLSLPRRRQVLLAVLFPLLSVGTVVPAQASSHDWVLLAVSVGPSNTDVAVAWDMTFGTTTDRQIVVGTMAGLPDGQRWGLAFHPAGGPRYVAAQTGVTSPRFEVASGSVQSTFATTVAVGQNNFVTGDTVYFLLAVAGSTLSSVSYTVWVDSATVTPTATTGSGSVAVPIVSSANSGYAVGAGVAAGPLTTAAVGAVTAAHSPTTGIAGALAASCGAGLCTSKWRSPDNRDGSLTQAGSKSIGVLDFATATFGGPAGDWEWDFAGGAMDGFSLAVYAPIGANYVHFD